MVTEFDDVLYVIDSANEVYWQVSKGVDEYGYTIFNFKTMPNTDGWGHGRVWPLTTDQFRELNKAFTLIRSEKEFLVWLLKYGN